MHGDQTTLQGTFRAVAFGVAFNLRTAHVCNEVLTSFKEHTNPLQNCRQAVFVVDVNEFGAPTEARELTVSAMKDTATKIDVVVGVAGAQAVPGHHTSTVETMLVVDVQVVGKEVVRIENCRVVALVPINQLLGHWATEVRHLCEAGDVEMDALIGEVFNELLAVATGLDIHEKDCEFGIHLGISS